MVQITYTLRLDMRDTGIVNTSLRLKQGDSGMKIAVNVFNGGVSAFDSSTTPKIVFRRPDGASVMADMTVESSLYSYTLVGNELQVPGKELIDIKFPIGAEGRESTMSCSIEVVPDTITPNTHGSGIYDNDLAELVEEATEAAETVQEYVGDSEAWADGTRGGVPVGPDDPAYHNNSKYWSEQANPTRLENLTDVDFNNLTDGDIIRYNSESSKWENSDALSVAEGAIAQNASDIGDLDASKMSYAVNTMLGAHNLADCDMATKSQAGFTATKGALSNGAVKYTITGSDTGTTGTQFILETDSKFFNTIKQYQGKRLKLKGCPAGGDTTNGYFLAIYLNYDGTVITANDTGDGAVINVPSVLTTARIAITLRHEANTGSGLVFTPLVALEEDTSDEVTPYAMTNRELTEAVSPQISSITVTASGTTTNTNRLIKYGRMVFSEFIINDLSVAGYTKFASLPEGFRPNTSIHVVGMNGTTFTPITVLLFSNGDMQLRTTQAVSNINLTLCASWCID